LDSLNTVCLWWTGASVIMYVAVMPTTLTRSVGALSLFVD
jgi:hypothetical protein